MGAPGDRNLINFSVNAGVTLKAPFEGRDDDTFGIGFGIAKVSGGARGFDRDTAFFSGAPFPVRGSETFIEVTYQFQAHRLVAAAAGLPVRVQPRRRHPEPEQSRPSASATKRSSGCAASSPSDALANPIRPEPRADKCN